MENLIRIEYHTETRHWYYLRNPNQQRRNLLEMNNAKNRNALLSSRNEYKRVKQETIFKNHVYLCNSSTVFGNWNILYVHFDVEQRKSKRKNNIMEYKAEKKKKLILAHRKQTDKWTQIRGILMLSRANSHVPMCTLYSLCYTYQKKKNEKYWTITMEK